MIEEQPLARLIRLRKYQELDSVIDQLLQESGWPEVASQLTRIPVPTARSSRVLKTKRQTPYYITEQALGRAALFSREDIGWGVRLGTLRDGIVHILGLQIVHGIDPGFQYKEPYDESTLELVGLGAFEGIQASNLHELRQSAIPVAIDILRSQAAEYKTFFLDVDAISGSPFAAAVPYIVEAREQEIMRLDAESEPAEIVETYHGFKVLTEGSIEDTAAMGFTSSSLDALDEMAQAFGSSGVSKSKFVSWHEDYYLSWRQAWNRYDVLTQTLLRAIMLVSIGGRRRGMLEGLYHMRVLGDSRVLPTLHRLLELIPHQSLTLHDVLAAIGGVGHPSSFDHLLPLAEKRTHGGNAALAQMALIRSPRSTEHLAKVLSEGTSYKQAVAAAQIWKTFDSQEDIVLALWNRVTRQDVPRVHYGWAVQAPVTAMTSLALIGEEGRAVLRKHPEVVASLIQRESGKQGKVDLIRLLRCVDGLMENPVMVKAIRELEPRDYDYTRFMADEWGKMTPDTGQRLSPSLLKKLEELYYSQKAPDDE